MTLTAAASDSEPAPQAAATSPTLCPPPAAHARPLRAVARVDERSADRRIERGSALDGSVLRSAVRKLFESFGDVRRRGAEQYRAVSEPLPAVDGLIGVVVQRALRMSA